jgi:hypothetical protein
MRTTFDLPDDLLRQAKIVAVQRHTTLRELVTAGLRHELARGTAPPTATALPAIHLPPDAPLLTMSPADIKAAWQLEETASDTARAG